MPTQSNNMSALLSRSWLPAAGVGAVVACRYRTVPVRGSILYFVIADLAAIDPMYQHSLAYFMQLFTHCIEASARTLDLDTRLNTLLTFVTNFVFSTVSSGLLHFICTHSQQPASCTRAPGNVLLTIPNTSLCVMVSFGPLLRPLQQASTSLQ